MSGPTKLLAYFRIDAGTRINRNTEILVGLIRAGSHWEESPIRFEFGPHGCQMTAYHDTWRPFSNPRYMPVFKMLAEYDTDDRDGPTADQMEAGLLSLGLVKYPLDDLIESTNKMARLQ